jgi:hypothetical protein
MTVRLRPFPQKSMKRRASTEFTNNWTIEATSQMTPVSRPAREEAILALRGTSQWLVLPRWRNALGHLWPKLDYESLVSQSGCSVTLHGLIPLGFSALLFLACSRTLLLSSSFNSRRNSCTSLLAVLAACENSRKSVSAISTVSYLSYSYAARENWYKKEFF